MTDDHVRLRGQPGTAQPILEELAVVRAFGDAPIDWKCGEDGHPRRRCSIRLAEVLEALEAGQDLVEVDDLQSIVKIWVE